MAIHSREEIDALVLLFWNWRIVRLYAMGATFDLPDVIDVVEEFNVAIQFSEILKAKWIKYKKSTVPESSHYYVQHYGSGGKQNTYISAGSETTVGLGGTSCCTRWNCGN